MLTNCHKVPINTTFVDKSEGCLYTDAVKIDIIT